MLKSNWRLHALLKARLVKERQMMSLLEKEIAIVTGELVYDDNDWVRMWVDTGYVVFSDDGVICAFRGIDLDGNLMWLIRHPKKARGYHALHADPLDAIDEARSAWSDRARVRARWPEVKRIAAKLFWGQKRFSVTRADAHRSALCGAGIDAFMKRLGMVKTQKISGRFAALLMLIEPQLGYVIYAAYERHLSETARTVPDLQSTEVSNA